MKKYKLLCLNKSLNISRKKDLLQSEEMLNQYISDGWVLQQIVSPADGSGALIAVIFREL